MTRIIHVPNEHKYSIYYNDINGNIKNTKKKIIKKLNWMKLQKQDKFSKIFMITYYKATMKPPLQNMCTRNKIRSPVFYF